MKNSKLKLTAYGKLAFSTDGKFNRHFELGPSVIMETGKEKHAVTFKVYKHKVKGQIDDWKFESDNWHINFPVRFRTLEHEQVLGMQYLDIIGKADEPFNTNYKLVLGACTDGTFEGYIYMKSIPVDIPVVKTDEFLQTLKDVLYTRPVFILKYGKAEDEKNYFPTILISIKAKTVAEACKVVEIFLEDVEKETRAKLALN